MTETKPMLADRVLQFQLMELPGQPMMMHMGTSYLISDLWSVHKDMAEALENLRAHISFDARVDSQEKLDAMRAADAVLKKAGG